MSASPLEEEVEIREVSLLYMHSMITINSSSLGLPTIIEVFRAITSSGHQGFSKSVPGGE